MPTPMRQPVPEADSIRHRLLAWYGENRRDLPWRRTADPYAVWVSEVILQQTRVDQAAPYYERFLRSFPTVQHLADASADTVLKAWEGLGYYTRARNLHRAAKAIAATGAFPQTAAEWQALPGIGPYTAGAIASIAFGECVPVVDGNVIRVLTRVFNISGCADDAATRKALWTRMAGLVPGKRPGDFNQAVMELGARVCTPKAPDCATCPLKKQCEARRLGVQEDRPVRRTKRAVPTREQVAAAVSRNGRYLFARRPAEGLLGGLWEMPSGDVHTGETHACAVRRILRDDFGLAGEPGGVAACVRHAYSHFRVILTVYACRAEGTPAPRRHTGVKWLLPSGFSRYAFPKTHHKFLHLLGGGSSQIV